MANEKGKPAEQPQGKGAAKKPFFLAKRLPLMVGLISGFLALILLQNEREEWQAKAGSGPQKEILVVTRDVAASQVIERDWIEVRMIPVPYVHPLSMGPADKDVVSGVTAAHALEANQPLLWTDIADMRGQDSEMSAIVRPNERAIALTVSDLSGVSRLIRNNDHVDIFGTFDRPDSGVVTVPILQNVVVISTGANMHGVSMDEYTTITVSVSPQEAALLTLAQETGRLNYVLRNAHDWETVPTLQRVSLDDLFEDVKRQQVQEIRNIRVVKGKL